MNLKTLLLLLTTVHIVHSWTGAGIRNHAADVIGSPEASLAHTNVARSPAGNSSYIRPCYFTNWAQYRQGRAKYVPEDYVPGLCTHILYAFGWMNSDFTVRAYDPADLPNDWAGQGMYKRVNALKNTDPQLKTLLSIGGWSFGTALFQGMSATATTRQTFINSAISFVRTWGFDGIDIDWEYPSGPTDMANFVSLANELKTAVEAESARTGNERLLVTAAVASGQNTIDAGYDVANLANSFDFILLMSYDFFGAWASLIGFNSPLYATTELPAQWNTWNVDWAANHWYSKGMPKNKIIVGMPTYGRGWTLSNISDPNPGASGSPAQITKYVQEAGVGAFYEFCEMLASGAVRHWDTQAQVPYLVQGNQWWSYDDTESFSNKMAWLQREQYGGAFVWTLDFDDFNAECSNSNGQLYPLISVIAKELGGVTIPLKGQTTTAAPVTTTVTITRPPTTTTTSTTRTTTTATTTTTTTTPKPTTTTPRTTTTTTVRTTTTTQAPFTCSGKADGFYPNSANCGKFILCLKGSSFDLSCPSGLHFSCTLRYCTQPINSGCVDPTVTTTTTTTIKPTTTTQPATTTTTEAPFNCTQDGFFGVPGNCLRFVRCVNGLSYNFECPNGLTFHADTQMCDRPDPTKCAQ